MCRKKTEVLASALLVVIIGLLFFCERSNPYDPKSKTFIKGERPHVAFVDKTMSAFLYDTVSIPVVWSDTAVGGVKGAIKTLYIDWHGDTLFNDSIAGTNADTLVLRKAFPAGQITIRIRALDYDGNIGDADSMKLSVLTSRPTIVTTGGSRAIRKASVCTLSVSASDTGGVIRTFFWARNGIDFNDTTSIGTFQVSYSDTGAKIVLVKARDNKGVESGVDTFYIAVYDKRGAVLYDGNGNTGGTVPTDANTYVAGQPVIVLGNTGNLVKSGDVFSGWNTSPNGSGANYSAGATFLMDTASAVLYAQWTANPTFGVVYDGNGNTGGTVPADTVHYSLGQSVTVLANTGSLVKTGNTFVGWNTEANGSGIGYAAEVSFFMGSANVMLYAQWTADPTYAVTYDGNGNTGGAVPVDSNNYLSGAAVIVRGNTGALVKTGNTFVGWNTKADGGGTAYASSVSFTMGSASVTLYAQWTALPTYTVTYDGNGSTGGAAPVDANSYMQGQTVATLNIGTLVKTGSTFTGWNTLADGTGTGYAAGATFAMGSANVTLYAQWSLISTYTVTYDKNTATSGAVPVDNTHYTAGQSVTVAKNTGNLAITGKTFVGWNTQANGSGIGYATGTSLLMGSANVTLYAQWTANPTYTVTYNGNTNSSGSVPIDVNNYQSGDSVTVLGNTNALVKTGYTFVGWNAQANGGGTAYASGVKFKIGPVSVTLYAQWTANPTYAVTYNGNVSTGGAAPVDANSYMQGQTVATLNIGTLVKTGSTFTGWNTLADGTGTGYAAGATFAMGTANVTLYAQWTIISTYTVTYDKNTATSGAVPVDNTHYTAGQSVTVAKNTGNLAITGKTFVGWNTQANGSGIGYATGTSLLMGSANVTLYAQWTANPTYTVTYNGNTNSGGTVPPDGNNYQSGDTVTVLGSNTLVKTGYTFVGWNTQANGIGGTAYATGVKFAMGSAGVTLYAQWTAKTTYTVTYNGNNNTSGNVPPDANNYLSGATVVVLGNTGGLARAGFTFAGWDTNATGLGTVYAPGVSFTIGSANVTLYAQWTLIPTYRVTYDKNGATSGTVPGDTTHYTVGQSVTVLGNTGNLAITGKTFVGWNTKANGTGIGYAGGTFFLIGSANVTLYAQWTANPTYTVTYNGNTNSGGTVPPDGNNYKSGDTVTVLGSNTLVKTGYTFVGWNTQANGIGGTPYATGVKFAMGSAGVTLYAQWTALTTYTVTYLGNDSTGGNVPVDGNHYLSGATVVVLGNTGGLVKTGFTFAGWGTNTGGGTVYAPGVSFTIGSANVTLYARWTLIATYTVTYNGNGATSGTVPVDNTHYTFGQSVTVASNAGTLAIAGKTFVGWNTHADGSGIGYAMGTSLLMGSASVTLYAQWTTNPTYTVTYNGNTNTGGNVPPDGNHYQSGDSVTVLGSSTLVKTGYTFVGWNTQANGGGTSYASGVKFAMGSAGVTLYAQWTALTTYTVTYLGNDSTGGNVPVDGNHYLSGATVIALGNTNGLVKTGFTFAGWDTNAGGAGTVYAPGVSFTIGSANVKLYAQWTLIPTYTVTYDGNGKTGGSVPVDGKSYKSGDTVTVLGNINALVKTGNAFAGWNTQALGNGIGYTGGVKFVMGSAGVTLYAQWTTNPTHTVTYNGNTNSGGTVPPDGNNYQSGDSVTVLGSNTLVKTGYTFVGWNTQANGGGIGYATGVKFAMGSAGVTLYAQWTALTTYTVTYLGNDSTGGNVPVDGNHYLSGATVIALGNTNGLVKTGFTFAGWGTNTGGGTVYAPGVSFTIGSANVKLYAQWTLIPTYQVTYNGNTNTDGTVPVDGNNYLSGALVTVLGSNTLVKTGYTFVGWNTQANGGGIGYAGGVKFAMGSAGVMLYAQWTANTYAVTYVGNDSTGGNVPVDGNRYLAGATVTVRNMGTLVKTGCVFAGWNTKADGTGDSLSPGDGFVMGSANVTLYAHWVVTITATADTAHGSISPSGTAIVTAGTNKTYTITPAANYHVAGVLVNGSPVDSVSTYTFTDVSGNATISVSFAINPYSITYDGNGSDGGNVPVDANFYIATQVATVLAPGDLSRTGYTFLGWATDAGGTAGVVGGSITIGTSSVTLYAQWQLVQ